MKAYQRKTTSGPLVTKEAGWLKEVKTEGAFQEKVDKLSEMLKKAPAAKASKK